MKIALAQLNYHTGNFKSNTDKIIEAIEKAKSQQVDLIVFAELCIPGYPARDFLEFKDFIAQCEESVITIASHCENIAAILGSPTINPDIQGKDLFNSAYFLANGIIQAVRHKTLLPNYDVFDEYRYFEPNIQFQNVTYKGYKIALTICEDLWNINHNPLYVANPMEELIKDKPDLMINIAASPFSYNQHLTRKQVLVDNARAYHLPLFYVNHIGAQTELIFDGGSLVLNAEGAVVDELNYFDRDFRVYDLEKIRNFEIVPNRPKTYDKIELIHDALVLGLCEYFSKLGFKKAILGMSGGIDSAIVLALAVKALGAENVRAVMMPSKFSSEHSITDSLKMCSTLKVEHEIISIEKAVASFEETLSSNFKGLPFDVTEENMQARCRAVILMALSNKFGYILLNTSNKSELAVGYGTLYGDMCGGLSVIGDVYKTQIFELARFINRETEIIPENIINKPPSAELRPDQKDSDSLPDYALLDSILYKYIEERLGPKEIIALGLDEQTVRKVLRLVNINEYKRHQTPPILRVSSKAFGMGRRVPIVAKYLS
jgi:NAD+ synthase (glutamine-hydrolysing)